MCFYSHGRWGGYASCLATDWDGLVQILVAFSAAFVTFLCLVQPTRRRWDDGRTFLREEGDSALRATSNDGRADDPTA
jgi:hypothetical protein